MMQDAFSKSGRAAVTRFASGNVLVGLDYDGTLAPIVDDPRRAVLRPRTHALLSRVAARYPCAVVSGRARDDVARFLRGVPVVAVVGNHGVEHEAPPARELRATVLRWRRQLTHACAALPGARVEDKRWSLSLHYRACDDKAAARHALLAAARGLPGARLVRGKDVVSVVHERAPHKGSALRELCQRFSCDRAIYVGDDETDEDVFRMSHRGRLLPVRVGPRRGSRARLLLPRQEAIDGFLELLLEARSGPV